MTSSLRINSSQSLLESSKQQLSETNKKSITVIKTIGVIIALSMIAGFPFLVVHYNIFAFTVVSLGLIAALAIFNSKLLYGDFDKYIEQFVDKYSAKKV